jgi:hypothetical protein
MVHLTVLDEVIILDSVLNTQAYHPLRPFRPPHATSRPLGRKEGPLYHCMDHKARKAHDSSTLPVLTAGLSGAASASHWSARALRRAPSLRRQSSRSYRRAQT